MRNNRLPLRGGEREDLAGAVVPADIKRYLDQRIAAVLAWYVKCDVCAETLTNVRQDLDSVMAELRAKFSLEQLPFLLRARFEGADLVVSLISREVS